MDMQLPFKPKVVRSSLSCVLLTRLLEAILSKGSKSSGYTYAHTHKKKVGIKQLQLAEFIRVL